MAVNGSPEERVSMLRCATRWAMPIGALALLFALAAWFVIAPLAWYSAWMIAAPLVVGGFLVIAGIAANLRWLGASLRLKKTHIAMNVAAMTLLMLAVVVLINLILSRHYVRFDLTPAKLFTLSQQTLDLLAALPKDVDVTEFASAQPLDKVVQTREAARDLLREYCVRCPRMRFDIVDFDRDQAKVIEFRQRMKVDAARDSFVFRCGDEARMARVLDLVLIPTESGAPWKFRGEQILTATLKDVTMGRKHVVYFTLGHGERDFNSADAVTGFSLLGQALERENFALQTLNLAQVKRVPEDCSILIVAGPQEAFSAEELQNVQAYLNSNGSLLAMFDPQFMRGQSAGWNDLLRAYGITVRDDVLDEWLSPAGGQTLRRVYPESYMPHPVSRDLPTYVPEFPTACALEVATPKQPEAGVPFYVSLAIASTGPRVWGEANMNDATRRDRFDADADLRGPLALAASSQAFEAAADPREPLTGAEGARIVVIANSYFAANTALPRWPGNQLLMLNAMTWLDPKGLPPSTIPARDLENRPIRWTDGISRAVLLVTVVAMPLMVIVFGALVWFIRRK